MRGGPVAWAALVVATLAVPYLVFEPASTDLAAQTFRADLWSEHGWVLWNEAWYSGHLVPGYSLIYPPLGAILGPQLVGVASALLAAVAFAVLVRRHRRGRAATVATLWFALGAGALLFTGRLTFMLGLPVGLLALLAVERSTLLGAVIAALAALASPVAGLFTALAGAALLLGGRTREGLALGLGALIATLALVVAFPVGGTQPFGLSNFWWVVLACALACAVIPPELRTLRIGIALYVALLIGLFVVATPIGSNAPRLGALLLGPLVAVALIDRRPKLVAIVALPLLYWQLAAPIGDLARGAGDPSTAAAFYQPLLEELDRRAGEDPVRVEIPPTRERWEAVFVGERYALARGWLRQLEQSDIEEFEPGVLSPESYERWLVDNGVSFVALPDADLDYIAEAEADLLEAGGLPFLREVWAGENWTLWKVLGDGGEVTGPGASLAGDGATITELGPDGFSVFVRAGGEHVLRMRWSPYFRVTEGSGCVADGGGSSTLLTVPAGSKPQSLRVDARLSFDGLMGSSESCAG